MRRFALAVLIALALVSGTGCEESVNAILESNRKISMYATLDMNADRQYIRVVPIRETIDQPVDASLYSLSTIDLDNGSVVQWRDSIITFSNGKEGLVFYTDLRVFPGHTYRIEATSAGSELVTSAETRIPPIPTVTIGPDSAVKFVAPNGFQIISRQSVVWSGLEREPLKIEQWYRFLRTPQSAFRDILFPFTPPSNLSNGQLSFDLDLAADRFVLEDSVDVVRNAFIGLGMRITILNTAFRPPGGVFDPEILVQPGTFSNVENGFGFIGTVGRFGAEWTLGEQTVRTIGYLPVSDAFGKADLRSVGVPDSVRVFLLPPE